MAGREGALLRLRDSVRSMPVLGRPLLASGRFVYVGGRSLATALAGLARLPGSALRFRREWTSPANAAIGKKPEGRAVVMLVVADMRFDPRVEREARALAAGGREVTVVWTDPVLTATGSPAVIDWGPGVSFISLPEQAGAFSKQFPGFLGTAMLDEALKQRPFAFHGHDLNTCLVALTAARRTGAHAVCDFHEWYSENVTWRPLRRVYTAHSRPVKAAWRWLERLCLAHASALVTVCRSIADEMSREFSGGRREVHVIRNIPDPTREPGKTYPPLKAQLGLPEDRFLLLWQGGIGPSRMIEPIIEALTFAPACTLLVRGPEIETYGPGYAAIAARIGASDRLILAPPVPSRDVVAAARGADAGIWTLPDLCKNFSYALPNKIFEYLSSGLPALVAHYPEAKRLVEEHEVGLTFDPYDPRSIAAAINRLIDDPALRRTLSANTEQALAAMDAAAEWRKLVSLYDGIARDGVA
jgi:glycosyltransferase involved in cell wall biosynthesis